MALKERLSLSHKEFKPQNRGSEVQQRLQQRNFICHWDRKWSRQLAQSSAKDSDVRSSRRKRSEIQFHWLIVLGISRMKLKAVLFNVIPHPIGTVPAGLLFARTTDR